MTREGRHFRRFQVFTRKELLEGMLNRYALLGNSLRHRGDARGSEAMYRRALDPSERLLREGDGE